MQRAFFVLSLVGALGCSGCRRSHADGEGAPVASIAREPQAPPDAWMGLGPGVHHAVRFELGIPAELADAQSRFALAARENQAWLQAYLKKLALPPGATLPYHPNLGVSEDEYRRLAEAYRHPTVIDRERFDVDVRVTADALGFSAPPAFAPVSAVSIERSGRLRYAALAVERAVPTALEGKFGRWSGFSWRRDESTETPSVNVDTLDVELGRIDPGGRRFLHVQRVLIQGGALVDRAEILVWIDD